VNAAAAAAVAAVTPTSTTTTRGHYPATLVSLLSTCIFPVCAGYRSNNFIVGLRNVSPAISKPTLWNYTLCGQYPGVVPAAATVSLYCQDNLPPFRYVIVQFNKTDHMNFCEVQVLVIGMQTALFCGENEQV